jgi:hypothetical protein
MKASADLDPGSSWIGSSHTARSVSKEHAPAMPSSLVSREAHLLDLLAGLPDLRRGAVGGARWLA